MPYGLEHWGDKAIVVNTQSGKHYSTSPLPLVKAKAQMRILEAAEEKNVSSPPKKWIQGVVAHMKKGAFTAQAKQHGMTVPEFREEVMEHPTKYSTTTKRRAQFLTNIQRK